MITLTWPELIAYEASAWFMGCVVGGLFATGHWRLGAVIVLVELLRWCWPRDWSQEGSREGPQ